MKYFAAFLKMKEPSLSKEFRPQHLDFLDQREKERKIIARGGFVDGTGGLVIYMAESLEDAKEIAESDPYVSSGARSLEIHEWNMSRID